MANAFAPLDTGAAILTAEKIANVRDQRTGRREEAIRTRQMDDLARKAQAGNREALNELIAIDPDRWSAMFDANAKNLKLTRAEHDQGLVDVARGAIVGFENPTQWPRIRAGLVEAYPEVADQIPEQLTGEYVKTSAMMATALDKLLELRQPDRRVVSVGTGRPGETQAAVVDINDPTGGVTAIGQPAVAASMDPERRRIDRERAAAELERVRLANEIEPRLADARLRKAEADAAAAVAKAAGQGIEIKAADMNAIRASSGQLFGGLYDPVTQRFSGLDKALTVRALGVSALAQRFFIESGGTMTHDTAVERAAAEYGIEVPKPARDKDGADIRRFIRRSVGAGADE